MRQPGSVKEVVEAGLCIGCGLCEALAPECWKMAYTPQGRLRPSRIGPGSDAAILKACPGAVARPNGETAPLGDAVWGSYHRMQEAWAGDPDTRFRAATGGVLTALAAHLLRSGEARFILHCAADPQAPMRSVWCLSGTPGQLLQRAGSRYGPSDTLAGLQAALDRDEPFAVIAKPLAMPRRSRISRAEGICSTVAYRVERTGDRRSLRRSGTTVANQVGAGVGITLPTSVESNDEAALDESVGRCRRSACYLGRRHDGFDRLVDV